jgi:predicted ArsR family transcriptional regulator
MSDLEQSVFNVLKRHPYCSAVLVAYKLGIPQAQVQVAMEQLEKRRIL